MRAVAARVLFEDLRVDWFAKQANMLAVPSTQGQQQQERDVDTLSDVVLDDSRTASRVPSRQVSGLSSSLWMGWAEILEYRPR